MIKDAQSYALMLETAFRRDDAVVASADEFRYDFKSCLESSVGSLMAQGFLSKQDVREWLEEYSFVGNSLDEILQSDEARERIEELYRRVKAIKQN